MTHVAVLRIKRLTGKAIIEVAAKHNHREILAEIGGAAGGHIDPARVSLNRILRGQDTAAGVADEARKLMIEAGVKPLKRTAVMALEIIFSLPANTPINQEHFFNAAIQWAGEYFKAPVISAIVHNDEAAPHCHVLLLPLIDGCMVGSSMMGGRSKLYAMQANFYEQVGKPNGLIRQAPQKRHSAAIRKRAVDSAFDVLEANSGLSAGVLLALLAPHQGDPAPLLLALGLTMPEEKTKPKDTFIGIMTRPCKPEPKPIGIEKHKPIGIENIEAPENELSLSCVGIGISSPSFPPPNEAQPGGIDATLTAIEKLTAGEHEQAPILDDTTASNQFISLPFVARIEPLPNPQPIDSRQRDLFDQPIIASSDSDQSAHNPQHHEYRVSEQRLEPVRTLLMDRKRCHSSDREIGRETGVSASIVRDMRAELMPDASQYRTFQRGGKTIIMNVSNIGKRPAGAQPSQSA
jgi:hypothetical protein